MSKRYTIRFTLSDWAIALAVYLLATGSLIAAPREVFQVDVPHPTADKPQSKLWFAHGAWWAWLPTSEGSGIWKRGPQGWQRQIALDAPLRGSPGRADVWADDQMARAVLVDGRRLAVVTLKYVEAIKSYEVAGETASFQLPTLVETATIDRDETGRWWIAYDWNYSMWVRSSDGAESAAWTEPMALNSTRTTDDDICLIVSLKGGIGFVWTDQQADAVCFRWHDDAAIPEAWGPVEFVDLRGKTADDHLNAAVARDGTLYLATKNEIDRVGSPQLVLRRRHPDGSWENLPYANRANSAIPSRPIALIGGEPEQLFLIHSAYPQPVKNRYSIICRKAALDELALDAPTCELFGAGRRINDATGCKRPLPTGQEWIVLASDLDGRVFESKLP